MSRQRFLILAQHRAMRVTATARSWEVGFELVTMLASLLGQRAWSMATCVIAMLHLGATWLVCFGFLCPIHALAHVLCPGCVLTYAMMHLLQAEWAVGLVVHPFASLFLGG